MPQFGALAIQTFQMGSPWSSKSEKKPTPAQPKYTQLHYRNPRTMSTPSPIIFALRDAQQQRKKTRNWDDLPLGHYFIIISPFGCCAELGARLNLQPYICFLDPFCGCIKYIYPVSSIWDDTFLSSSIYLSSEAFAI